MKIEADILDNYKTKVLQEQNEQYLKRIQELEKEHKMIAPLMAELIATLQKHGLTTSLQADIEVYKSQFMGTGRTTPSNDQKHVAGLTASGMGRHQGRPRWGGVRLCAWRGGGPGRPPGPGGAGPTCGCWKTPPPPPPPRPI